MSASRVKALLALVLMVAAFGGAAAWKPRQLLADQLPKVDLEVMFPRSFGDWAVDDRIPVQLISPDQAAILNAIYNQTLSRTYVNRQGDRIMLSVAYGGDQSDGTRAHRPEVCYPAQGFQLQRAGRANLSLPDASLAVRRLETKLGNRLEPITYWVVVGDRIALSGTEQKLAQLAYSTRGIVPDGMLVRVSSIDPVASHAFGVHERFVSDLLGKLTPENRLRIAGRLAS